VDEVVSGKVLVARSSVMGATAGPMYVPPCAPTASTAAAT
jgi:hypothetical protein